MLESGTWFLKVLRHIGSPFENVVKRFLRYYKLSPKYFQWSNLFVIFAAWLVAVLCIWWLLHSWLSVVTDLEQIDEKKTRPTLSGDTQSWVALGKGDQPQRHHLLHTQGCDAWYHINKESKMANAITESCIRQQMSEEETAACWAELKWNSWGNELLSGVVSPLQSSPSSPGLQCYIYWTLIDPGWRDNLGNFLHHLFHHWFLCN